MKSKRLAQAALGMAISSLAVTFSPAARGDVVSDQLNQSQANRLSVFHDYSIDATGSTAGGIPTSSGGGLIAPFVPRISSTTAQSNDKDWVIGATPLIGYDSNPEARELAKGSFFGGIDVNAKYETDLTPDDPTHVYMSGNLTSALYEGMVKEANVVQPTVGAGIRHGFFDDTILLGAQMKDQWTVEHGASFLNSFDFIPTMEYFWYPQISTEVALDYANMSYFFPVNSVVSPTTNRYELNFNLHLYPLPPGRNAQVPESPDQLTDILRATLHSVVFGYAHVWNQPDGHAYRYQANRISIGIDSIHPLKSPDLNFSFYYAHEWQNYLEDTPVSTPSLNTPTAQERRDDHLDVLTFRTDARLVDLKNNRGTLGGFFQWDLVRDWSRIEIRDFNEFVVSAGLSYQY